RQATHTSRPRRCHRASRGLQSSVRLEGLVMKLSDNELGNYVTNKLALPGEDRNAHRQQVNRLLETLEAVLAKDGTYRIKKFRRAGALEKGTSNRPRAGKPVDADVRVSFEVDDTSSFDIAALQQLIKKLLVAA